jgi:hypothetical protein
MRSFILFLLSLPCLLPAQQTDTTFSIIDSLRIKEAVYLSNNSEVFNYDSLYIWNDKRNLSEILDERPGYFIYNFGLGGRNNINYNSKYSWGTGIFRDGIQLNDNFFQGFDIQNLSVNEIDKIEEISAVSSFFYGINSFSKSINVITKDVFNSESFSQLRYSQDRAGSLYADFYFSQPFTNKLNLQLGITNHSADGRYENSGYNFWRGRSRLNIFLSPKLNFKLNFFVNNLNRDLNDGLVYKSDKDSLLNPSLAEVVHPSTSESLENFYYDLTATMNLFKDPNSLTKLKIYSINSLRNLENPSGYYHSLQYAAELLQNFFIRHNSKSNSNFILGGNYYYNTFDGNLFKGYNEKYISFRLKYDFNFKNFFTSALLRNDIIGDSNFFNYGIESSYKVFDRKDFELVVNAGVNETKYLMRNESFFRVIAHGGNSLISIPKQYYEAGGKIRYKSLTLAGSFFGFNYDNTYDRQYGFNSSINLNTKYFIGNVSFNYSLEKLFPVYYAKGDLSYNDILFNGKLKLRTGINFKYYKIKYITEQYQTRYSFDYTNLTFPQKDQFIADFYIGARIGKANINLTIANIFNALVYNAYLFPLDDRGGLGNILSRFTIVWDFIN